MPVQNSVIRVDSPKPTGSSVPVVNNINDGKNGKNVNNNENININIFQSVSCPVLGENDPLICGSLYWKTKHQGLSKLCRWSLSM